MNGFEGLPRPRRSNGSGIVTVPFTNGLAVSKARIWREGRGKFQVGAADPNYEDKTQNRAKNQRQFENHRRELRLCRLAIATDTNRKPIWLKLPVIFHRPIPELAEIRSVTARRNLIAGKAHWKLCITIRGEKPANSATPLASAVSVGWRKREDGHIRVAYLVDENGHQEELLFPASDMAQYRQLDDLQGIMSSRFNEIRDRLAAWFRSVIPSGRENGDSVRIPRAVLEACSTDGTLSLHQWKSASRLVRLMWIWKNNRFQGDQQPWDALIHWYHGDPTAKTQHQVWKGHMPWSQARRSTAPKPDLWNGHRHLYLWWSHLLDQLHRRRRERYRVYAAGLARKYGTIFIDDFDLRSVIETPPPEQDKVHDRLARFQRFKVAPGLLRQAIKNVCLRESINMLAIDAKGVTHTCPKCGVFIDFDAAKTIMYMCEDCGERFDQDYAAAKNILNRGINRSTWGARVIVA